MSTGHSLTAIATIHEAMGGQGFSTLAITNGHKRKHRPRKWHETVADTHLKGWIFHTFTGKPWTMSTKRNYKLNYICKY